MFSLFTLVIMSNLFKLRDMTSTGQSADLFHPRIEIGIGYYGMVDNRYLTAYQLTRSIYKSCFTSDTSVKRIFGHFCVVSRYFVYLEEMQVIQR